MSLTAQGPGWWMASDGKFYPPEQMPTAQRPAEPPKKKFYKRVWFWLLIAVVVLFGGCSALLAGGSPVEFVIGASTASRLFGEIVVQRSVGNVTVTTDDGTAGSAGLVTDVLPAAIERVNAEVVYGCGPMPMLAAVAAIARTRAIHAQVAVEEAMACGIGVCMTCVLPVRGEDGRSRFVRSCVEGPVFDADRIRWDDVGRLPVDLVGADAMAGH